MLSFGCLEENMAAEYLEYFSAHLELLRQDSVSKLDIYIKLLLLVLI